jgi:HSP20 family molecular chaperone IbpA
VHVWQQLWALKLRLWWRYLGYTHMQTDPEALRNVLRASPSVLARQIGQPTMIRKLRDPAEPQAQVVIDGPLPEPSFDIFDEGHELLIVGELQGVVAGQLRVYGYLSQVVIHVRGRGSRYSVRLPQYIDPASICYSFCNNILALRASRPGLALAE